MRTDFEENRMKKSLLLSITLTIAAALLLSACGLLSSSGSSSTSGVLFSDDFSSASSGWDRSTIEQGSTDYADGAYHIIVNAAQNNLWANPGQYFTDVSVEVDATLVSGTENNDYGVICRYQDVDNFYYAEIASDGYYGISKVSGGTQSVLTDGYPETTLVNTGYATNHIRVDCVGSTISLYINGTLAESVTDSDIASGDVGLIAGTYDEPNVDIAFDNFVVNQP
jgi:hypothetical protein